MNDTAAQPEAAPAEGQGAESGAGNELYAPFLEGVPEDIHDHLIPALKAQDAEFTKKFQSNSERTKPFEELGIFDQSPETIGQYLSLDQTMQAAENGDPQAIEAVYNWWDSVGEALKFYEGDDDESDGQAEGEEFDVLEMDKTAFDKAVEAKVQELMGPVNQQLSAQQQQAQEEAEKKQVTETIEGWVSEVTEANPGIFEGQDGEAIKEEVMELAVLFPDSENPVKAGLEKYQSLVGKGETDLFQKKQDQPAHTPEGGGRPDTTPPPIRTMEDAKRAAEEYLRNGKQMAT